MKPRSSRIPLITSALFAVIALTPAAYAADWLGNTDANFGTVSNWSDSASPNNKALGFGVAGTAGATLNNDLIGATYNGLTFNNSASAFTIGGNSFTLNGNITNNSSSLQTINTAMTFGARTFSGGTGGLALGGALASTGSMTVNSGAVTLSGASTIDGGAANNNGFLTLAGNTSLTVASGGSLGILGTTGGTKPNSIVGQNAAGTSTLWVNGGSLSIGGNTGFVLGNNVNTATGVLTVSSGTATITAGSAVIGNMQNFISMGRDNAHGVINLDGGTLATGRQFVRDGSGGGTVGSGTATFNFNGGVLQAQANQTSGNGWFETATTGNFQVVTTIVKAGGARIDTNGFNTNINTNLAHDSGLGSTADGGLTKSGTGTLTLGGANTYTGKTTVSAGTLALAASGSIANSSEIALNGGNFNVSAVTSYTVGASQSLTGAGTVIGDVTVNGALAIGSSPGTMVFDNNLTLGSTSVSNFEFTVGAFTLGSYDLALGGDGVQTITFNGALNLFFDSGEIYADGSTVQIFDFENYDGDFTEVSFTGLQAHQTATFDAETGIVTVIPEPGVALLGGLGMLALLRRRRN